MKSISSYNYIILGLGNPGAEYTRTRHNAGRNALTLFAEKHDCSPFTEETHLKSLVSEGTADKKKLLLLPETFVNKSGEVLRALKLGSKKHISEKIIVVHDDLDIPLGTIKIVQNRGSAGHKGVESIMRAAKTNDFVRIRIGIANKTDITKRQSQTAVHKIVIGALSPSEKTLLKKGITKAVDALAAITTEGVAKAMNEYN